MSEPVLQVVKVRSIMLPRWWQVRRRYRWWRLVRDGRRQREALGPLADKLAQAEDKAFLEGT